MELFYIVAIGLYCMAVYLNYSSLRTSGWFIPAGLVLSLITNLVWLFIVQNTPDKHLLYVRGLIWDAIIVGAYALIPILFFGVRLTGWTLIGGITTMVGLVLMKVG